MLSNYVAHRLCNIRIRMRDELAVCGCEMKYPNIRDEICEIGEAGKGCSFFFWLR
jgi:hypothetical protein